jgi:hypothetical protein
MRVRVPRKRRHSGGGVDRQVDTESTTADRPTSSGGNGAILTCTKQTGAERSGVERSGSQRKCQLAKKAASRRC